MKQGFYIAIIWMGVWVQNAAAQEPDYEMLFSRKTTKNNHIIRAYGMLTYFHSPFKINDKTIGRPNLGAEIGMSYKRTFGLGLSGQSVSNYVSMKRNTSNSEPLIMIQQIGMSMSYVHHPGQKIHGYARLFTGRLTYTNSQISATDHYYGRNINPNVGLEYNLLPSLTFRTELGYRFTSLRQPPMVMNKNQLSGFIGGISLKIGNIR